MPPFACPQCTTLLHFETRVCPACAATVGYDPAIDRFRFLTDEATAWSDGEGVRAPVVACANNNDYAICNWLVDSADPTPLCRACRHNHVIPDLTAAGVPERWARIEEAKRRLFHTLIHLGLPLGDEAMPQPRPDAPVLAFDFLYDPAAEKGQVPRVITGHDSGLITLNLIEADDAARERIRQDMGEPYRTLLGHFRHEIGHFVWSLLVEPSRQATQAFRKIFGDERADYGEALQAHYNHVDDGTWQGRFISFYATSHPWEDFAETFAHYLHMVDLLATMRGFDLSFEAPPDSPGPDRVRTRFDPYTATAAALVQQMQPLAFVMNTMGRSLGQGDLYPFEIALTSGDTGAAPDILAKLDHIAQLLAGHRVSGSAPYQP